jgi:hypothetical protein
MDVDCAATENDDLENALLATGVHRLKHIKKCHERTP